VIVGGIVCVLKKIIVIVGGIVCVFNSLY